MDKKSIVSTKPVSLDGVTFDSYGNRLQVKKVKADKLPQTLRETVQEVRKRTKKKGTGRTGKDSSLAGSVGG